MQTVLISVWRRAAPAAFLLVLGACTQPPSWQKLLANRIAAQFPAYQVQPHPDGSLLVRRPGHSDVAVDVDAIARFCQRGRRDCDYATDQLLLELQPPSKQSP